MMTVKGMKVKIIFTILINVINTYSVEQNIEWHDYYNIFTKLVNGINVRMFLTQC